jgi:hypothetical protein
MNDDTKDINLDGKLITVEDGDVVAKEHAHPEGSLADAKVSFPETNNEVANKAYVDAIASGFDVKFVVKAASTNNVNINSEVENGDDLDGALLFTGEKILLKDQADPKENGIYIIAQRLTAQRLVSMNIVAGTIVYVEAGKENHEKFFSFNGAFTGTGGSPNYGVDDINLQEINTTPLNPSAGPGADNDETFNNFLTHESPNENVLGLVDANQAVTMISIKVLEAFNDENASLTIGDSTNGVDWLVEDDEIDLTITGKYIVEDPEFYTTQTQIKAFLNPGTSTTGVLQILVTKT